jgi:hypothetical protein
MSLAPATEHVARVMANKQDILRTIGFLPIDEFMRSPAFFRQLPDRLPTA